MAKNKGRIEEAPNDFQKFAPKDTSFEESLKEDGVVTEMVNPTTLSPLYDAMRRASPTEVEEMAKDPARTVVEPPRAVSEAATDHIGESAIAYLSGRELPFVIPKEGANPLLVRAYKMMRSMLAGGLISPFAGSIIQDYDDLMNEIKKEII